MSWALLIVQILFGVATVAIFAEFNHGKNYRNLLASVTFGAAAITSYYLVAWWPLLVGFALLWVYKLMGLEPGRG
jgi:hypothetical protein